MPNDRGFQKRERKMNQIERSSHSRIQLAASELSSLFDIALWQASVYPTDALPRACLMIRARRNSRSSQSGDDALRRSLVHELCPRLRSPSPARTGSTDCGPSLTACMAPVVTG